LCRHDNCFEGILALIEIETKASALCFPGTGSLAASLDRFSGNGDKFA
jgi:hypothetical protein